MTQQACCPIGNTGRKRYKMYEVFRANKMILKTDNKREAEYVVNVLLHDGITAHYRRKAK